MKKTIAAAALAALLAIASAGCQPGGANTQSSGKEPAGEDVVASLQDYKVSLDDYTFYYRWTQNEMEFQAAYSGFGEESIAEFWNLDQGTGPMKDLLAEQAMGMAKQYAILGKLAAEKNVQVSEETAKENEEFFTNMMEQVGNDEAKFVEEYGFSSDLMRKMWGKVDLVNQYLETTQAEIAVTDEEITAEYETNKDLYDKVTVRHILIASDETMTPEEQAAAKTKADDLLKQIEGGADMAQLVADNTADAASIETKGEYTFGKGEMTAEFEDWAFAAQPGDRGVVQTSYGYHVMEMISRTDFEGVKEQVKENIQATKLGAMMEENLKPASSEEWVINQALVDTLKVVDDNAPVGSMTGDEIPKEMTPSPENAPEDPMASQ